MPRDIPVGNGNLLVTFDREYRVADFYYPHVGQENHNEGTVSRFGVWCEGRFAWMGPEWTIDMRYEPETLVTHVVCHHAGLELDLECADAVDFYENVYLRRVTIRNLAARRREVRLFFCQDFNLYATKVGDTAFFDPTTGGVIHYKARRYLLVNLWTEGRPGVPTFTCGNKEVQGLEGSWRDAEDGQLAENPIAQGTVDSAAGTAVTLEPQGQGVVYTWIAGGRTYQEVRRLNQMVIDRTPEALLTRTRNFWHLWVNKEEFNFEGVPEAAVWLFKRSQLVLRTQIDNGGAILAANDSDIVHTNRDTYSYCWPRDGALAAYALIKAGHGGIARRFFDFAGKVIHQNGFFLHKYNPDGSLASSWHPWMADHTARLPIQEDETALVLWAFWRHFQKFRDIEFVAKHFRPTIVRAAEFLAGHVDPETHLPLPSYDLWEERWGVHTWTVATVIGALRSAAQFAVAFGEQGLADRFRGTADRMHEAMGRHLWSETAGRFARSLIDGADGPHLDTTIDASLCGLVLFGAAAPRDPKVEATLRAVRERLVLTTQVGGVARYDGDAWHRQVQDTRRVPGNPWFVCTLWMMRMEIAEAETLEALDRSFRWMDWAARWCRPSGILAEQLHPDTGDPVGVSPLSWSHAEVVAAMIEYLEKRCCLMEQQGQVCHIHQRGRYADRYLAADDWETSDAAPQKNSKQASKET